MVPDELERRLQGWALWLNGAGKGRARVTSSIYTGAVPCRYRDTSPARIDGEAMDVDLVVSGLPLMARDVLGLVYLRSHSQERAARILGCSIRTLERHLAAARVGVRTGLLALSSRVAGRLMN